MDTDSNRGSAATDVRPTDTEFKAGDSSNNHRSVIKELILIALVSIGTAIFLTSFVIFNAYVPTASMENTIMTGDRLLGLRLSFALRDPQRGEVVVFRYPVDDFFGVDTPYVKRIIGLPGETIKIEDGSVYTDGKKLEEPYLEEEWTWEADGMEFLIPEDSYFMLGDNRNDSFDSRFWAAAAREEFEDAGIEMSDQEIKETFTFVKRDQIIAKAWARYWPIWKMKIIE